MVPRVPKVLMMLMAMVVVVVMETMIVSAVLLMWDACQQSGADCWPNVQTCHLGILAILLIMLTRWHWWYWSWWLGWWWSWWWGWWWWCWYSRCYWWRGEASVWCWLEPQLGESRAWLGLEGGERFPSKIAKAKIMILQSSEQRKTQVSWVSSEKRNTQQY